MTKMIRSWFYSVLSSAAVTAAIVAMLQARTERWERGLHNVADVTVGVTVVFALLAAFILAPACLLLGRMLRGEAPRHAMAVVCVALAPFTFIVCRVVVAETGDPHTAWTWLYYWMQHSSELVLGASPFVLPGAVFGLLWPQQPDGAGT